MVKKGLALATIFIFAWAIISVGCAEGDLVKTFEFTQKVTRVEIINESGNLCVKPSEDGLTTVDFDLTYDGYSPDYDVRVVDSVLYVMLDCRRSCNGNVAVKAPSDAVLNTETMAGHVYIQGMENDVSAMAHYGNLVVDQMSGRLTLESEVGHVFGGGITSRGVFAEAHMGDVDLIFNNAADIIALTDAGYVKLQVPSGSYDISVKIGSGKLNLDGVKDDPDASNSIDAETVAGTVDILGI